MPGAVPLAARAEIDAPAGKQEEQLLVAAIEEAEGQALLPTSACYDDDCFRVFACRAEESSNIFGTIFPVAVHYEAVVVPSNAEGVGEADGNRALVANIAMKSNEKNFPDILEMRCQLRKINTLIRPVVDDHNVYRSDKPSARVAIEFAKELPHGLPIVEDGA
jgi:hypothetical protein